MPEPPPALEPDRLHRPCDPDLFDFETTDDLEDLREIVGQERAARSIRFGLGIRSDGYNVFALGPEETDKRTLVRSFVERRALGEEVPTDLCYVNDFDDPHRPRAVELPAGVGCEWSRDMDRALEEMRPALAAAFESEEYQARRQAVQQEVGEEQQASLEALQEEAGERGLALVRTPAGFVFAPVEDGEVVSPEKMEAYSEEKRARLEESLEELRGKLQGILRKVPGKQREARRRLEELNREVAAHALRDLFTELRNRYADHPPIRRHLDEVQEHVVDNVRQLLATDGPGGRGEDGGFGGSPARVAERPALRRYRVNVLVDRTDEEHAPVVYEDNPTYQNLVGRVEYLPQQGALVTDFNLIRPGALHRARGGYLLLDARRVLLQPFAWEGLKRALTSGKLRIESPREALGLVSTVTVEPEPVTVDTRVVLLGDRRLYYLLAAHDPDFLDLFKVQADFDDRLDRTPENERLYAKLVGGLVRDEGLRPFDRGAVARVVERSARMAGDQGKLAVRGRGLVDLVREADHWAGEEGAGVVGASHVRRAVEERIHRADRVRERIQEEIERGTIFIATEGREVGQINGLSVLGLGDFAFGKPARITARTRMGEGEVVDIEREVELSGPLHAKGVLILQGFLAGRYASDRPLSLQASLVFEQSYGGVDGDSASSTELYALLSSIAGIPLRQDLAVTGSVNQRGEVQPIGGVNEKVEGFFDVCRARGLTGEQGVLVPAANVRHLMLREEVREAVAGGLFHVYPVEHVDRGMELLTGLEMGERGEDGRYPEGTVNARVEARLGELAEKRRAYGTGGGVEEG